MKETIAGILQQRMDKCTNEQFWAVATLSGMDAFVLSKHTELLKIVPLWALVVVVTLATGYGVWFIIQRHSSYYFYRTSLANLLQNEKDAPDFLKRVPSQWRPNTLSGVIFYVGWVVGLWLFSLAAILK